MAGIKTPYKFKHNYRTWTIKLKKKITNDQGQELLGLCHTDTHVIDISEAQNNEEKRATLLHELLHAAFPPGVVGHKKEEQIVSGLEDPLLYLLEEIGWLKKKFSITRKKPTKIQRVKKSRKKGR